MKEKSRLQRDPPSAASSTNRDPPSAYDHYIQSRRQQSKRIETENANKSASTIRFSNNLEVHTKQPPNHRSDASTTSILRTNNRDNNSSTQSTGRRKESLLEKLNRQAQEEKNASASEKIAPPGPVRPRKDWNIQSLFPSAEETKQSSRQMTKRSRMVDLSGGIHTRLPTHEQKYSSEYLLNKYAEKYTVLSRASTDGFVPKSASSQDNLQVPIKSNKFSDQSCGRVISDSISNERLSSQGRFSKPSIGRKKELSYLQLDERIPHEEDLEFHANQGYNLANLIHRYTVNSPISSVESYDDALVRKNTSDTDSETASNQNHLHFDNSDFQHPPLRRPRRIIKKWAVLVLIAAICFCLASTLIIYLLLMRGGKERSTFNHKIGVEECTRHGHSNGRFVSDRYNSIRHHLLFQPAGNVTMMDYPGSPQRQALCWISEFDDYNIDASTGNEKSIVQRYSLAVIYFSAFGGKKKYGSNFGSIRDSNILSPVHECEWDDVICNHAHEATILRFSRKTLSGTIPLEIGNLKRLNFIDLSQNELTGQLPESITKLRSLEYISLAFNEFKTSIPTFFGQMTSLNTLNLRSSGFVGQIPKEIGYLSYLELLLLDDNSLNGTIPSDLGSLSLAQQINMRDNDLSGTVPVELCELRINGTLRELEVDKNIDCSCCA